MKKLTIIGAALVGSVLLAPGAQAANLVVNGDFEGGSYGGANRTPLYWTVQPGKEIKAITGQEYATNAGASGSAAALANTYASFGSGNAQNRSSLISSAFQTVAGQVYRVIFSYGQFGGTPGAEPLDFGIFTDGGVDLLAGVKPSDAGNTGTNLDTVLRTYKYNYFVGNGELAHVFFSVSGQPTNSVDGLLDNVVITAVPEAATWLLMIVGFAAVGTAARVRRRQVRFS